MSRIEILKQHISEKRAIKVIAGIGNFNIENIKNVVSAAEQAGASAVDVAFSKDIISMAKEITTIPVMVSSIVPAELAKAVEYGADAIEIGNFDTMYRDGKRVSAQQVFEIVKDTKELLGNQEIFMSVTIPGHIEIAEQIELAHRLEDLHVDLIQTEGAATVTAQSAGARGLLETAQVSIANTIELARNTDIAIMTASGITTTTAPMAFAAGASAVGVGSCVNKLNSTIAMIAVIRTLVENATRNASSEKTLLNA
ncbi:MAG: DUF561 domain-containing protein [Candidatus Gastranaerophilales bacterium]|nr:DUF561 domain-containing protein [Candidatus Gastranaerophilales bacterium]